MTEDREGFNLNRAQVVALHSLAYKMPRDVELHVWLLRPAPTGAKDEEPNGRESELIVDVESEQAGITGMRRQRYKLSRDGGRDRA